MCVAVVVKSKETIPAKYLQAMAEHNPDGGGIAWIDGDQVQYRKGLTWEQINAVQDLLPRPFLMHFRIATRGGKIPELTHPFPVGFQAFSEDLVGMAPSVIIHNGTWSDYRKYVPKGINENLVSDTQTAAYVASWNESILDEVKWSNALMIAKSENGKPRIRLRGNWDEFEGNLYSNFHWRMELNHDDWSEYFNRKYGPGSAVIPSRTKTQPIQARKKGEPKSYQQAQAKLTSKRAAKRAAKAAKRAAERLARQSKTVAGNSFGKYKQTSPRSAYDAALSNYNSARGGTVHKNPEKENQQLAWGDRASNHNRAPGDSKGEDSWHDTWESERLFTDDQLKGTPGNRPVVALPQLTSEKYIPCPDCGEDIKTIPCECGMDGTVINMADIPDVEDLNAEGLDEDDYYNDIWDKEGDTSEVEHNPDLCLSGDSPEDWNKVDAWIRAQGIKI